MMDELSNWCRKWRMRVNSDKIQVVHFRGKRVQKTECKFYLGANQISVVKKYRYLGCTITEHLNLKLTGDSLAEGAGRALGKVTAKHFQNKGLGYNTYTKLYNTCIIPIMDYGFGIWGYSNNDNLDKIHQRAIRVFLGVGRFTPIPSLIGDIGWTPPIIRRKICMLRLWNSIIKMEECRLPKIVYNDMQTETDSWLAEIKSIFNSINAIDVFERNVPIINFKQFCHRKAAPSTLYKLVVSFG